ncbi:MAG: hypothetical protein LBS28_05300 [Streptococcaceae bacterium]|jgi:hypothetical protein|nr:hypothetical protein [Streptococcaceae bacterium]
MKQIGGNFFDVKLSRKNNRFINENAVFTLNGRIALNLVIENILKDRNASSVYFPSYACESMIKPFIDQGVSIDFYDVKIDHKNGFYFDIACNKQCDIIFLIQYFDNRIDILSKQFKQKGVIVIEDVTYSLFLRDINESHADYVFGSLRKWTGLYSGGFYLKMNKTSEKIKLQKAPENYIFLQKEAKNRDICFKSWMYYF